MLLVRLGIIVGRLGGVGRLFGRCCWCYCRGCYCYCCGLISCMRLLSFGLFSLLGFRIICRVLGDGGGVIVGGFFRFRIGWKLIFLISDPRLKKIEVYTISNISSFTY